MFGILRAFRNDTGSDNEIRELVELLENDKNIKVVGRGTVIRSIESDPSKNKEFNDMAERLASKFVMG